MISVLFPPGTYGTFLSSCLYLFTELSKPELRSTFDFSPVGDSHLIRKNKDYRSKIQVSHIPYLKHFDETKLELNRTVVIRSHPAHWLDYLDNQFIKQELGNFENFLMVLFPRNITNDKLKQFNTSYESFAVWQMREYVSYWLVDCLRSWCDTAPYDSIGGRCISTVDLFDSDFVKTFSCIASDIGLSVTDVEELYEHHQRFVTIQKFNNIQVKCEQWVDDVLDGKDTMSPCLTIFDEAYVQHLLRQRGFEIKCYLLNEFPTKSRDLSRLLEFAN